MKLSKVQGPRLQFWNTLWSKYLKRERARGENILKSTIGENDAFSVQNLRLIPDDNEEHGHAVELRLRDRGGAVMA
ncbi:hypothetical protein DY000_02030071 [Brassica cretica]|uniref:Uncharacterized protein n=1 Tax=Brassica cretica TaxID=69181 RepID=A0ABQ7DX26_BRACR|nr:hypothetical protein DY000_02030071 [Brassica cretica]